MKKIETSALIGLGALGILFGRKMPGVKVIADAERVARYSAQPVVCNGKECHFDYVTPEQGQPVDLVLVAVKATVLEQAIKDIKKFVGPDTIIISVLNGITSENDIEAVYPGHCLWSVAIGSGRYPGGPQPNVRCRRPHPVRREERRDDRPRKSGG